MNNTPATSPQADGQRQAERTTTPAQHTPGPWSVEYGADNTLHIVGPMPRDYVIITQLEEWLCRPEEQRANARLIASAPDLLVALRHAEWKLRDVADWLTDYVEPGKVASVLAHADECAAAIARTEGQEAAQ